jgi:hypothetical protein
MTTVETVDSDDGEVSNVDTDVVTATSGDGSLPCPSRGPAPPKKSYFAFGSIITTVIMGILKTIMTAGSLACLFSFCTNPCNNPNECIRYKVHLWCSDQTKAESLYGHISTWNTTEVTDMTFLFKDKFQFNDDIGAWDVSNVVSMEGMFTNAFQFNRPMKSWNVSKVESMAFMFVKAMSFNQRLDHWDVRNIKNLSHAFAGATSFEQSLDTWNMSSVIDNTQMFHDATAHHRRLQHLVLQEKRRQEQEERKRQEEKENRLKVEVEARQLQAAIDSLKKCEDEREKERELQSSEHRKQGEKDNEKVEERMKTEREALLEKKRILVEERLRKKPPGGIIMVGRMGTGKSTVCNNLYNAGKLPDILCTPDDDKDDDWCGPFEEGSDISSGVTTEPQLELSKLNSSEYYSIIDTVGFGDKGLTTCEIVLKTAQTIVMSPQGFKAVVFLIDGRISEEIVNIFQLFRTIFPGCERNLLIVKNKENNFLKNETYSKGLIQLQNGIVGFEDAMKKGAKYLVINANPIMPQHYEKSFVTLSQAILNMEDMYRPPEYVKLVEKLKADRRSSSKVMLNYMKDMIELYYDDVSSTVCSVVTASNPCSVAILYGWKEYGQTSIFRCNERYFSI